MQSERHSFWKLLIKYSVLGVQRLAWQWQITLKSQTGLQRKMYKRALFFSRFLNTKHALPACPEKLCFFSYSFPRMPGKNTHYLHIKNK